MKLAHMKVPRCFNGELCVFPRSCFGWRFGYLNKMQLIYSSQYEHSFQVEIGWRNLQRSRSHLHSLQQACLETCWDSLLFPLSSFPKDNHNENSAIGKSWNMRQQRLQRGKQMLAYLWQVTVLDLQELGQCIQVRPEHNNPLNPCHFLQVSNEWRSLRPAMMRVRSLYGILIWEDFAREAAFFVPEGWTSAVRYWKCMSLHI